MDGTNGCLNALNKVKLQYPQLKILLSVGGGGENSANFAAVAANHNTRFTFAQSAKSLVEMYSLDGIDSKTVSQRKYLQAVASLIVHRP